MDPSKFRSQVFGQAKREPGNKWSFWYFHPNNIPREIPFSGTTIKILSEADSALGKLQGTSRLINDPQLLLGPALTKEALSSSRIEGTEASLSDVLKAEASGQVQASEDVAEVENYLAATREAQRLLGQLPISQRLIRGAHKVLMQGVRGSEKLPGEFRKTPVWVGSPTDNPETATYVPPLPDIIPDLMKDWEIFVNNDKDLPVLVRCALMHYQFETIHPFLDGNGRIGRLLIVLFLMTENRLDQPILYISGYLESHRREYYDRLQSIREEGEIEEYIQFFLTAVARSAEDAADRAEKLVSLREKYRSQVMGETSRIPGIVDLIFSNPFITVKRVAQALDTSEQGARNLIQNAEKRGWVTSIGTIKRGRRNYWVAQEIFTVLDAPFKYMG